MKHKKLKETSFPSKIVNKSVFPLHTWVIGVAVLRSGKTSNCIRLILLERESNISVIKYTKNWFYHQRSSSQILRGKLVSYQALALGAARQNTHSCWSRRGFAAQSDLLGWEGIKSQGNENNLERCDLHLRLSESYVWNVALYRNYSLLSVLATSFFTFETKKSNLFDNRVYVTAKVTIILDKGTLSKLSLLYWLFFRINHSDLLFAWVTQWIIICAQFRKQTSHILSI